ncbi:MAG: hypothetical protein H6709_17490 [Kofleriaceae bacterium]|nr:hypothetical protein [Kofleriaceae bacterium]
MPISAYDAVMLAVAVTVLGDRRGRIGWVAVVPLVAALAALAPLGEHGYLVAPVVALVVTLPPLRAPAPALVLAVPTYGSLPAAALAAALYVSSVWLADLLDRRVEERGPPPSWRGAPARLLVLAVLYATLLPVGHL